MSYSYIYNEACALFYGSIGLAPLLLMSVIVIPIVDYYRRIRFGHRSSYNSENGGDREAYLLGSSFATICLLVVAIALGVFQVNQLRTTAGVKRAWAIHACIFYTFHIIWVIYGFLMGFLHISYLSPKWFLGLSRFSAMNGDKTMMVVTLLNMISEFIALLLGWPMYVFFYNL